MHISNTLAVIYTDGEWNDAPKKLSDYFNSRFSYDMGKWWGHPQQPLSHLELTVLDHDGNNTILVTTTINAPMYQDDAVPTESFLMAYGYLKGFEIELVHWLAKNVGSNFHTKSLQEPKAWSAQPGANR